MSLTDKVRNLTRRHKHRTLADLLRRLNPVLRGWCNYFQHGVSKRTFDYLDHFTWWRVMTWLRKRHHGLGWGVFHRLARAFSTTADTALVNNAVNMAVDNRTRSGPTIPHADHGTQFTSWGFGENMRRWACSVRLGP
ncbi:group II intron, maturase-specific domain protein [Mycobacterium kansasii 824]|nr:group II intron, maturase-specific domain protein [Mycobacterium kansasii 824]